METTTDTTQDALDRIAAAWDAGDASAYAAEFTEDASYVIYVGLVYSGRDAIEQAHVPVFAKYQRGTRMSMRILEAHAVAPDVTVVTTEGGVGKGRKQRTDKVQTFTLVLQDGRWKCAAFQNTKKNRFFIRMDSLFNRGS